MVSADYDLIGHARIFLVDQGEPSDCIIETVIVQESKRGLNQRFKFHSREGLRKTIDDNDRRSHQKHGIAQFRKDISVNV